MEQFYNGSDFPQKDIQKIFSEYAGQISLYTYFSNSFLLYSNEISGGSINGAFCTELSKKETPK